MRDIESLPPLPHTAPQMGGEFSSIFNDSLISRKTAPASLGISYDSITTKFSSPAITPATFKWNQRLERLIKSLGKSGSSSHAHNRTYSDTESDERIFKVVQFDKNWTELMQMIEFAKNLNDNENWKESMLDFANYNGPTNGFKKTKIKSTAPPTNGKVEQKNLLQVPKNMYSGLAPLPSKKPLRVIMGELQRKLQDYKTDSLEWEALQMRVDHYSGLGRENEENFLRRNRNQVGKLLPVLKKEKTIERIQKQKQRQLQVLQAKKILDQKILEAKLKVIKDKEHRLAQTLAHEKDFLGSLPTIQAKWFAVVFVAIRVKKIQDLLEKKLKERKKFLTFQHAAIVVQRWYRSLINEKLERARKNAIYVISYHFKKFLKKWKAERLRKASFTLQLFFKEVYDVSKLLKVVKKYRFSVIKAQRIMKSFVMIKNARLLAITKYWDIIENDWWVQRQKSARGSGLESGKDKKKKATKNRKDESNNQHISMELKSKYILENLIARRKHFLEKWGKEFKSRKGMDNAAKNLPFFPLLPKLEEMHEMMDKAFVESRGLK